MDRDSPGFETPTGLMNRDLRNIGEFLGGSEALIRQVDHDLNGSEAPTRLMTCDVGALWELPGSFQATAGLVNHEFGGFAAPTRLMIREASNPKPKDRGLNSKQRSRAEAKRSAGCPEGLAIINSQKEMKRIL